MQKALINERRIINLTTKIFRYNSRYDKEIFHIKNVKIILSSLFTKLGRSNKTLNKLKPVNKNLFNI
jgi:hypothetical protein